MSNDKYDLNLVIKSFHINLLKEGEKYIKGIFNDKCKSIPLPNRKKRYTVLWSPHIDKKSRDQFEIVLYSRLIIINNVNHLNHLLLNMLSNLPYGIIIKINEVKHK